MNIEALLVPSNEMYEREKEAVKRDKNKQRAKGEKMNDRETERQKKSEFRFKISKQNLCSFVSSIYSSMHKSM